MSHPEKPNDKRDSEIETSAPKRKRQRTTSPGKSRLQQLTSLLHFWLSPSNLCKDRFLVRQFTVAEQGWVDARLFTTFNKAIALRASVPDIVTALSLLQHSHIEADFSNAQKPRLRVRGSIEGLKTIVLQAKEDEHHRTVYVEPLPCDTTREQLLALFQEYGNVLYVSLPTFPGGKSKGFGFVEYSRAEDAEQVIAASQSGALEKKDVLLPKLTAIKRSEWYRRKEDYKTKMKTRKTTASAPCSDLHAITDHEESCGVHTGDRQTGEDNEISTRVQLPADQPEKECAPTAVTRRFEPGLLVAVQGLDKTNGKVTRRLLYEDLEEHGPLAYIDFSQKTSDKCIARFRHSSGARRAVEGLAPGGGAKVLGAEVRAELLVGERETSYWLEVVQRRNNQKQRKADQVDRQRERRAPRRKQPGRRGRH